MNRHRLNWSNQEICDLMETVGGYPYLVRVALPSCQGENYLSSVAKSRSY
ncbi:AAA-like domain-containing protein [Microcoleus sp. B3-A4]